MAHASVVPGSTCKTTPQLLSLEGLTSLAEDSRGYAFFLMCAPLYRDHQEKRMGEPTLVVILGDVSDNTDMGSEHI